jgi:hypothetical protein
LSSRNNSAPNVTRLYGKASTRCFAERAEALIHQKRYDGMCEYYDGNLSLRQNRCFSLAGAVAEIIMRSNRNDKDDTTERLNSSEIWAA